MIKVVVKLEGIIVRTTNYGETSLILDLFTKELGIIGIMAKGVKSLKSKLRAYTMKFTYGFFYVYYKEGKLSILKEVDLINPFKRIHEDLTLISYLNYITELSIQTWKESENKSVFPLMIATLQKINEGFDPFVLTSILEMKYLPFLGVGIDLSGCAKCGNTHNIVTIDGDVGGLVCKNCYTNERIVNPKTIQLLRIYEKISIPSITKLEIEEKSAKELSTFLEVYYDRYTGLYLQSKDFLKKIKSS
ncbi:MAG: DNA repair protein RecO [Bacilli bacterium]|nr:DNA repair protein RecO [Bacilli bacterium]